MELEWNITYFLSLWLLYNYGIVPPYQVHWNNINNLSSSIYFPYYSSRNQHCYPNSNTCHYLASYTHELSLSTIAVSAITMFRPMYVLCLWQKFGTSVLWISDHRGMRLRRLKLVLHQHKLSSLQRNLRHPTLKNNATFDIFSGLFILVTGICYSFFSFFCWSSKGSLFISFAIVPGAIPLTLIPLSASSKATVQLHFHSTFRSRILNWWRVRCQLVYWRNIDNWILVVNFTLSIASVIHHFFYDFPCT